MYVHLFLTPPCISYLLVCKSLDEEGEFFDNVNLGQPPYTLLLYPVGLDSRSRYPFCSFYSYVSISLHFVLVAFGVSLLTEFDLIWRWWYCRLVLQDYYEYVLFLLLKSFLWFSILYSSLISLYTWSFIEGCMGFPWHRELKFIKWFVSFRAKPSFGCSPFLSGQELRLLYTLDVLFSSLLYSFGLCSWPLVTPFCMFLLLFSLVYRLDLRILLDSPFGFACLFEIRGHSPEWQFLVSFWYCPSVVYIRLFVCFKVLMLPFLFISADQSLPPPIALIATNW